MNARKKEPRKSITDIRAEIEAREAGEVAPAGTGGKPVNCYDCVHYKPGFTCAERGNGPKIPASMCEHFERGAAGRAPPLPPAFTVEEVARDYEKITVHVVGMSDENDYIFNLDTNDIAVAETFHGEALVIKPRDPSHRSLSISTCKIVEVTYYPRQGAGDEIEVENDG